MAMSHGGVKTTARSDVLQSKDGAQSSAILQVRYESNITSKDTFYTDSNGREMLKRVRDYRPTWKLEVNEPVSGNYYPLTAGMYLKVSFLQGQKPGVRTVLAPAADTALLTRSSL